jgi:predicted HTH transcriptional regulator
MNIYLYFIIDLAVGGILVWWVLGRGKEDEVADGGSSAGESEESGEKAGLVERQAKEKEENKKKIMEFFDSVSDKRITNNDVEKLLGVSDATATRYLDELEKEGLARQAGEAGRSVYYTSAGSGQAGEDEKI